MSFKIANTVLQGQVVNYITPAQTVQLNAEASIQIPSYPLIATTVDLPLTLGSFPFSNLTVNTSKDQPGDYAGIDWSAVPAANPITLRIGEDTPAFAKTIIDFFNLNGDLPGYSDCGAWRIQGVSPIFPNQPSAQPLSSISLGSNSMTSNNVSFANIALFNPPSNSDIMFDPSFGAFAFGITVIFKAIDFTEGDEKVFISWSNS